MMKKALFFILILTLIISLISIEVQVEKFKFKSVKKSVKSLVKKSVDAASKAVSTVTGAIASVTSTSLYNFNVFTDTLTAGWISVDFTGRAAIYQDVVAGNLAKVQRWGNKFGNTILSVFNVAEYTKIGTGSKPKPLPADMLVFEESNDPAPAGTTAAIALPAVSSLPATLDWTTTNNRLSKAVIQGAPKYQGLCGSCWAMGSTTLMEAYLCMNFGQCQSISANYAASCSKSKTNANNIADATVDGCDGSNAVIALHYLRLGYQLKSEAVFNGPNVQSFSGAFSYLGCYVDDGNRDMSYIKDVASVADCQAICPKKYFAIQNGNQCFCSDTFSRIPSIYKKVSDAECGGTVGFSMGAGWRNAVYRTYLNPITQYVGCYVDDPNRDMGQNFFNAASYLECQQSCTKNYISLQYGGQCFCSDDFSTKPVYSKAADSDCGAVVGDGSRLGGGWRNAIYDNRPIQYIGCYVDDGARDMAPTFTNVVSVAQCAAQCTKRYIGLQAGFACFCSDIYARSSVYRLVANSECGGEVGSSMGAGWRNAVYHNPNFNPSANDISSIVEGVEILLDGKAVCPVPVDTFKTATPSSLPKISLFKTPIGVTGTSRSDTLKQYIWAHGPAMTKIDASNLQSYIGGALTDGSICNSVDYNVMLHSVIIVGWKKVDNIDVWILRNSYSTLWGDKGYLYTQIANDICGVAANAVLMANANIAPANRNFLSAAKADPSWIVTVGSTRYAR